MSFNSFHCDEFGGLSVSNLASRKIQTGKNYTIFSDLQETGNMAFFSLVLSFP